MKAKVNLHLLKTTTFDSGAVGLMAMVLHQFRAPAIYSAAIKRAGTVLTDLSFRVDEKSEAMQLNIDLAQAARNAKRHPENCNCSQEMETGLVVSPEGFVLFYASSGDGYSVTVSTRASRAVFDSTKLGEGDLFAVSLLEPGTYSMANKLGSAAGEIHVSLTEEMAKKIRTLETEYVSVTDVDFAPNRIKLTSSQGLVFQVKQSARIVINQAEAAHSDADKPVVRWRKH